MHTSLRKEENLRSYHNISLTSYSCKVLFSTVLTLLILQPLWQTTVQTYAHSQAGAASNDCETCIGRTTSAQDAANCPSKQSHYPHSNTLTRLTRALQPSLHTQLCTLPTIAAVANVQPWWRTQLVKGSCTQPAAYVKAPSDTATLHISCGACTSPIMQVCKEQLVCCFVPADLLSPFLVRQI